MSTETVIEHFREEFGRLTDLFAVFTLTYDDAAQTADPLVARPGVYVHHSRGEVVKVGRSFTNARKRALEHIRDDTGGRMANLGSHDSDRLILFTIDDALHWVSALEVYLELKSDPAIKSRRLG